MKTKISKLLRNLNDSFQGTPWHGESLLSQLKKIDFRCVNKTLPDSNNSIAILIQHLIHWRIFVIEKLNGNETFDIEMNSEADWKSIVIRSQSEWEALINELVSTQNRIVEILKNEKEDSFLENKTLGKTYSYDYLIEGVIKHDIYHSGQIGLLNSYLK